MKIVTWNCNGALRNKYEYLLNYNADLYVIQECENPKETRDSRYIKWAENYLWIGDSKNKGLGVFASSEMALEPLDWSNSYNDHSVKYFLPCSVNGAFDLLAVWTHQNNSPNFAYIGQFWKYLQVHKSKLHNVIVAGDFNSNSIWDEWDRWWNHSDVVRELAEIGIDSFYHKFLNEKHGKESLPTFFLHRNRDKPYHIDYVFGSNNFINGLKNIELGHPGDWLKISDHLPMICDLDDMK